MVNAVPILLCGIFRDGYNNLLNELMYMRSICAALKHCVLYIACNFTRCDIDLFRVFEGLNVAPNTFLNSVCRKIALSVAFYLVVY